MRRVCSVCNNKGIRVGRIVMAGPAQCEYCGTEFEVARLTQLPYAVTAVLALVFLLAWLADRLNGLVVLALCAAWLSFDVVWELLKPLRVADESDARRPR